MKWKNLLKFNEKASLTKMWRIYVTETETEIESLKNKYRSCLE